MQYTKLIADLLITCLILSGCSSSKNVEEKWTVMQEKVATFGDGEYVDLWRNDLDSHDFYKLSDGETLLTVKDPIGPDNVYVGGAESLNDLNETAQEAIIAYYEKQGLLYDVHIELEEAYSQYLKRKTNNEQFYDFLISQDIVPASSNDKMICFLTSVILPIGDLGMRSGQEIRLGAVFNKDTGEPYNIWDLFYSQKEEAVAQLLQASQITDKQLILEMTKSVKPEYFILFPDNLEVSFPRGLLPSQEHLYSLSIDYEDLEGVIHNWAIPDTNKH